MKYAFYVDSFVLTNLYMDFLALYSVAEVLQQKKSIKRYLVGAALGSVLSCILLLTIKTYTLYVVSMHVLLNPGMITFCFFPARIRTYIKAYGLMYLVMFVEGGFLEWIYITLLQSQYYEFCVLLTGIPVFVFLYVLRRRRSRVQIFYETQIIQGDKKIDVQALYDTGNRLYDPYTHCPVQIVSAALFERVWANDIPKIRFIPFSTVADKADWLRAFTVEEIAIKDGEYPIIIRPAVLAVAKKEIFGHGEYQMILHQDACNNRKEV